MFWKIVGAPFYKWKHLSLGCRLSESKSCTHENIFVDDKQKLTEAELSKSSFQQWQKYDQRGILSQSNGRGHSGYLLVASPPDPHSYLSKSKVIKTSLHCVFKSRVSI